MCVMYSLVETLGIPDVSSSGSASKFHGVASENLADACGKRAEAIRWKLIVTIGFVFTSTSWKASNRKELSFMTEILEGEQQRAHIFLAVATLSEHGALVPLEFSLLCTFRDLFCVEKRH